MLSSCSATTSLRSLLLLLALAASNTSALLCDFTKEPSYSPDISLSSQQDVDAKFEGCTEIIGNIVVESNYTGPLHLANVTSIDGSILAASISTDEPHTPLLTSLEFPDLNYTREIYFPDSPSITNISFPRLPAVQYGIYFDKIGKASVNFASLTTTGGLDVSGNATSLNFPLLKTVNGDLRVTRGLEDSSSYASYLTIDHIPRAPLDISFPALQNASSVFVSGNISSLSMPRLSSIPLSTEVFYQEGLRITTFGNPLNISLPRLSETTYVKLAGTIGSISFPSLLSVEIFSVNSFYPIYIDPAPLKTISSNFQLMGNITGVSMSTITNISSVFISSELDLDCSPIFTTLQHTNRSYSYADICRGTKPPPNTKTPLKLGLGIGLGVPAVLALIYFVYIIHKRASQRVLLKDIPPDYDRGVPPTYTPAEDGIALPKYAAATDGGSEQGSEAVTRTHSVDESGSEYRERAGGSAQGSGTVTGTHYVDGSSYAQR